MQGGMIGVDNANEYFRYYTIFQKTFIRDVNENLIRY
jgi:hypothetical protein